LRHRELRGRFGDDLNTRGKAALLVDATEAAKVGRSMARRQSILAQGGRLGREHGRGHGDSSKARGTGEARRVGSGLRAKLSEIEVGAGSVSGVHGLVEAALGVVSVKNDAVEQDADDLDHDLDDDADEGPVLETADQAVFDLVGEDDRTGVLHARPSPHVFVVAGVLGIGEDGGSKDP
jgi:hypothetical protein